MASVDQRYMTYALDSKGNVVFVDDVPYGKKCGCFCPICKNALLAKNRSYRSPHSFVHQSGTECAEGREMMLHLLAIDRVWRAFLGRECFLLRYVRTSYCPANAGCKYLRDGECRSLELKYFNLKTFYDSCEPEV